ncbi:MAG: AAA family ATPase [Ktedonobacteraceae bacterium]
MIVFILGRTGSGKSTTARFLGEVARHLGWSVQSFNDYFFLRNMYLADTAQRFRSTENDGFEVLDLSVYETAIKLLARQVRSYYYENKQTFITVEFTSNNYRDTLQFFGNELLQDARILFLNADLYTCLERTRKRIFHRTTADDYYVKDTVLLRHYPCPYMPLCIGERKSRYIENMGSLDNLYCTLQVLVSTMLEQQDRSKNTSLQEAHSALLV